MANSLLTVCVYCPVPERPPSVFWTLLWFLSYGRRHDSGPWRSGRWYGRARSRSSWRQRQL